LAEIHALELDLDRAEPAECDRADDPVGADGHPDGLVHSSRVGEIGVELRIGGEPELSQRVGDELAEALGVPRAERDDARREPLELGRRVDVRERVGIELDDPGVQFGECVTELEVTGLQTTFEHRQHTAPKRAGERPGLRNGGIGAGVGERAQVAGSHERRVDRQNDGEVVAGRAQSRDEAGDRGAHVRAVVEQSEGEI